ncbi:BON domain-containing protein [Pseudomonas sp. JG-B]|nr:BON domain-containing protein [Pseudomonas sp. BN606]MRK22537.1 BON domain-containing protein [Pseudomonas sp. JG-B]
MSASAPTQARPLTTFSSDISPHSVEVVMSSKPAPVDSAKSTAKETGGDIADSWITTKVKSTLMYSSNVNGSDISVSTNSGIVTLSGLVDNDAERDRAIELAQNVRGVKSVRSTELRY